MKRGLFILNFIQTVKLQVCWKRIKTETVFMNNEWNVVFFFKIVPLLFNTLIPANFQFTSENSLFTWSKVVLSLCSPWDEFSDFCSDFFVYWHINLHWLFKAKAILVECFDIKRPIKIDIPLNKETNHLLCNNLES